MYHTAAIFTHVLMLVVLSTAGINWNDWQWWAFNVLLLAYAIISVVRYRRNGRDCWRQP